jgi:ABC-2 type transport system ATP-binding protein
VLELVGLSQASNERIGAFSKGMRERLGLAQALIHEPELLILDEPMSGLDPIGRRDVREIILAQRERGRTVFFSSHILSDVEAVCDRVAIISSGRLVEAGPLHKLISRKTLSIDVTLEGVSQDQLGELEPLARRVIFEGSSLTVTVADYDAAERIVERARGAGARLMALVPRRESLEEYFMRTQGSRPGVSPPLGPPGAGGGARSSGGGGAP